MSWDTSDPGRSLRKLPERQKQSWVPGVCVEMVATDVAVTQAVAVKLRTAAFINTI